MAMLCRWRLFNRTMILLLQWIYKTLGIRTSNCDVIEACLLTIDRIEFPKQRHYIDTLQDTDTIVITEIGDKYPLIERKTKERKKGTP
uniref:DUF4258 domain-containing protein n=1 Tax=Parastrongyloides trichosuri TaxID=131310 RepID=A0A0N4ZDP6_PARTI